MKILICFQSIILIRILEELIVMKPFKAKRMMVIVNGYVVGVVEGLSIEFIREGGIEPHYCSETGKHAIGTKHATFSIRRWMYIDSKKRLLFDLFNDKTQFCLEFGLAEDSCMDCSAGGCEIKAGTKIVLSDCVGYRYRPVTGAANDIIAEEISGEAIDWIATDFQD